MADNELTSMLGRRLQIEEGKEVDKKMKQYVDPREEFAHPYPEFSEFTREQCKAYEDQFAKVDLNHNDYISYDELKHMLEKRGEPFTHLELKKLITAVDEDKDGQLSFREFMLLWQKCLYGDLPEGSGLSKLVAANAVVLSKPGCADKAGVGGASNFFETKARAGDDAKDYEEEIRAEQRKKNEAKRQAKRDKEAKEAKKAAFAKRAGNFGN